MYKYHDVKSRTRARIHAAWHSTTNFTGRAEHAAPCVGAWQSRAGGLTGEEGVGVRG